MIIIIELFVELILLKLYMQHARIVITTTIIIFRNISKVTLNCTQIHFAESLYEPIG